MINIAIVEDDLKYKKILLEFLKKYSREKLVDFEISQFSDGDGIVENYDCRFDLILMDIMMKFMDGMSAAEFIRKQDERVTIIFITNMVNYAVKGYQVGAFDYILKPITHFSLERSLDRALSKMNRDAANEYINITTSTGVQKVALKELFYIESDAHYLTFYTKRGDFRTYMRMRDVENALSGLNFYRINKGIIVNLRYIDGVEENCCMINNNMLPISRGKKKEFMEILNYYMSSHYPQLTRGV